MAHRLLTGVATAALTCTALVLPATDAWGAACVLTPDPVTQKVNVTADCELSTTFTVPDGFTLDGNEHTITVDGSTFGGTSIISAAPSGGTPTSMIVSRVHIVADGFGGGSNTAFLFDGAFGKVQHSSLVSTGGNDAADIGVRITDAGVTFLSTQKTLVSDTTISNFGSAGVRADGKVSFNVLTSRINGGGNGADGVLANDLAHGKIQDTRIILNDASAPSGSEFGTGVHLDGSRRVEIKRNVFTGGNADIGVMVEDNFGAPDPGKATASIVCSSFTRHEVAGDSDPLGFGVAQRSTDPKANANISESTFTGWKHAAALMNDAGTAGARIDQGPSAQPPTCAPNAPTHVVAGGGNNRSKVTWHAASAPEYAPVTGYDVTAKAPNHPAITKHVKGNATSALLTGLNNRLIYNVTVRANNASASASASDKLYPTALSLGGNPSHIRKGQKSTLQGKLSSKDPNAHLARRAIVISAKPVGGAWHKIATARTTSTGNYSLGVRPGKKTTYKASYGGGPDLASQRQTTVFVAG